MQRFLKIFLSLMLLILPVVTFAVGETDSKPTIQTRLIGNDFYAVGQNVNLSEEVGDDAFLIGAMVNASSKVGGDLTAAGSNVTLSSEIGDDLRAAGSNLVITSKVAGSVLLAGATVTVSDTASFGADSKIAAGVVNFSGKSIGSLDIMGGTVNFSGAVEGDLKISAKEQLVISPNAKVTGKLIYTAKEKLDIPAGVAKEVLYLPSESKTTPQEGDLVASIKGFSIWAKAFSSLIFFIAGMFVLGLLGKASTTIAETARNQVWQSALTGALLFLLPVFLGLLLLATGVGSIVGVFVLLGWIALLLMGGVLSGFIVGSFVWKQTPDITYGKKLLVLLIGLVIAAALSFIPKFGGLLSFLIFIYSVGVVALAKLALYKAAKKAKLI
ncbi:MAG: hypothetical protein PHO48_01625 [Candidatus Gracilibacteria bacterium]|nr:hypothetical protein [Candidatus Gracilibacteria bacterium]MDD5178950.1 hypothetical protein [Candidatus Gracilibacteria bacterium]